MSEKKQKMDLIGQTYGRLTVVGEAPQKAQGGRQWKCQCACGREKIVSHGNLRSGMSKSCGCEKRRIKMDLTGEEYGHLTVLEEAPPTGHTRYWKCLCACGNEVIIKQTALRGNLTESCGCIQRKRKTYKRLELSGQTFGGLTVLQEAPKRGRTRYWACLCACGVEKIVCQNELRSGQTVSCGCLRGKVKANLTGNVYGQLTVLEEAPGGRRTRYWQCRCACGNEMEVRHGDLTHGIIKSCGCRKGLRPKDFNLTGQIYGQLTVVEEAPSQKGLRYWKCRCTCGNETVVRQMSLRRGTTGSCGCMRGMRGQDYTNLTWQTFGRLTVLDEAPPKGGLRYWRCHCSCGNEKIILQEALVLLGVESCGCLRTRLSAPHT